MGLYPSFSPELLHDHKIEQFAKQPSPPFRGSSSELAPCEHCGKTGLRNSQGRASHMRHYRARDSEALHHQLGGSEGRRELQQTKAQLDAANARSTLPSAKPHDTWPYNKSLWQSPRLNQMIIAVRYFLISPAPGLIQARNP